MAKKKTKKEKLINTLHKALLKAGIQVERDGWQENKHSVPPNDNCEWLDIILKDKDNHKYTMHFYFTNESDKLDSVALYKAELIYDDDKILANTHKSTFTAQK